MFKHLSWCCYHVLYGGPSHFPGGHVIVHRSALFPNFEPYLFIITIDSILIYIYNAVI